VSSGSRLIRDSFCSPSTFFPSLSPSRNLRSCRYRSTRTVTRIHGIVYKSLAKLLKARAQYCRAVYYFVPCMGAKYYHQRVCISVRLSVCSLAYLEKRMSNFTKFSADVNSVAVARSFDDSTISYVLPVFLYDVTFSHNGLY